MRMMWIATLDHDSVSDSDEDDSETVSIPGTCVPLSDSLQQSDCYGADVSSKHCVPFNDLRWFNRRLITEE